MALYLLLFVPIGTTLKLFGRDVTWWDVFAPFWSVVIPFLIFAGLASILERLAGDDE